MRLAIILLALVAGCAEHPRTPDPCKQDYAGTVMECRKPKPRSTKGMTQICEYRGLGPGNCYWVDSSELHRILRGGP